ncbi:MAG: type II toxin-antitoxin system RelE/ParE family toxin [Chlorobium sp.]|uniref:Plasmid stabilization system n=1 Tax=Chlorobium phaeobacteroides (strain BS1) TaxID=331678 RepID=B3EN58_CHLPB|nr:type II toxin-antitoxin system RelE/ParE family toxin [bacterium]MBL6956790.1 type II toxin-antitoxin system RelE/ParE family toxin [Chlorobium phaeobacteroides]MCW8796797.1 type II toxin-antitoxin system RelE/ParE family toxin [Chlorobium sp.]MCW8815879.1 type II toxin-antitoxin system RelE/ParE family toxin [Chlorobium sp.]NEX14868.1 type II toxin-antitoxin system RelE/ParE family toxin [Prosthecochloris sp.]
MSIIVFDTDARSEFLSSVEYYEECRAGLGRRFREVVELAVNSVANNPFRYRVLHKSFRRCLIPKFPHAIIFSIEPDFILVIAVAHVKRKPGYWNDRIEKYR